MTAARFSGRLPHLTSSLTSSPRVSVHGHQTNADRSKDDSGYGVIPSGSKMSTFKYKQSRRARDAVAVGRSHGFQS
jgi:hypothetical protein